MSEYSKEIEEIKQQLAALGSYDEQLEKLYRNAVAESERAYTEGVAANNALAEQKKREASEEKYADRLNFGQYAADRGLSKSGESVQAELNRTLIEANKRTAADTAAASANAQLKSQLDSDVAALNSEKAEKLMQYSQSERERLNERLEDLLDMEYTAEGSPGNSSDGNDADTTEPYTPKLSASSLAQALMERFSGGNDELSEYQSSMIKEYLQKAREDDGLGDDYIRDVEFVLKTHGYDPGVLSDLSSTELEEIKTQAERAYDNIYRIVEKINGPRMNQTLAKLGAEEEAAQAALSQIYSRVYNITQFETVAKELGYTPVQINEFYQRNESRTADAPGKVYLKKVKS